MRDGQIQSTRLSRISRLSTPEAGLILSRSSFFVNHETFEVQARLSGTTNNA